MKNKLCFMIILIFSASLFHSNISYGNIGDIDYINVNISKPIINKQAINFESIGGFSIYNKEDKINPIHEIEENSIKAIISENGDIDLIDLDQNYLFTIPQGGQYFLYGNGSFDSLIKIEKDNYRGYLCLDNIKGNIRLINHIYVEDYLYGLVPREMPASFPEEALKAQAVAGRTYAIHNKGRHSKDGYDLCASTHCQVYLGYDGEKASTNKAVDDTRGILVRYNGNTIDAQYHSSSSGYTNDSIEVWGGDVPYLKAVKDEYSVGAPSSIWNISLDMNALNSKLAANGINIGELQDIQISKVSENGNVNTLILRGSLANKEIKSSSFRSMIGNMDVKSTNFTIKTDGSLGSIGSAPAISDSNIKSKEVYVMDGSKKIGTLDIKRASVIDKNGRSKISAKSTRAMSMNRVEELGIEIEIPQIIVPTNSNGKIIIEGKGFGHGVGMSQYGAKKMAELGYSFEDILKHYYTGIDTF